MPHSHEKQNSCDVRSGSSAHLVGVGCDVSRFKCEVCSLVSNSIGQAITNSSCCLLVHICSCRNGEHLSPLFYVFNGKPWITKWNSPFNLPSPQLEFSTQVPSMQFVLDCHTCILGMVFQEDWSTSSLSPKGYSWRKHSSPVADTEVEGTRSENIERRDW